MRRGDDILDFEPRGRSMDRVMERIAEIGIVPVITLDSADKAAALGRALVSGGLPVAEITFRTSAAGEAIRAMSAGAPESSSARAPSLRSAWPRRPSPPARDSSCAPPGTRESSTSVSSAAFPCCRVLPAPTASARALAKGLEAVKLFPAEVLGGCAMLDALAGPFGSMRFVPTGASTRRRSASTPGAGRSSR